MQFREFLLSVNHGAGTENLLFAKNVLSARSFNGKESFAIPVPSTSPRDTELRATEGRSRPLPVVMQFAQQWEPQWAKGPT
ncbi:hypothetical protein ALC56_09607 [Trachymyrmex septentrionalis]|uniref:Uncharacterized protein n=1 Tax=Trachymyrmex septentrionalis TaxID=34720 RepID=A0A195F653_9HYME|nr:hypothetical protein ALC56_09607 [Trachymyrmex septentrionalis]